MTAIPGIFFEKINFKVWVEANVPIRERSNNGRNLAAEILEWEGIREGALNFDSSVLTRYGEQDGAKKGYNPKKKGRGSHHPLLAFLSSGYIVNFWNRSGDTSSGQGVREFLKYLTVSP